MHATTRIIIKEIRRRDATIVSLQQEITAQKQEMANMQQATVEYFTNDDAASRCSKSSQVYVEELSARGNNQQQNNTREQPMEENKGDNKNQRLLVPSQVRTTAGRGLGRGQRPNPGQNEHEGGGLPSSIGHASTLTQRDRRNRFKNRVECTKKQKN